jgi:protease I
MSWRKQQQERSCFYMKALIISADGFEDTELLVPYYRLREEGMDVHVASMKKSKIRGKHGYEVDVDKLLKDIHPDDYDLLLLPGGNAPEAIRKEKDALEIAKYFFQRNKPVSAICHGPQILITAGLLKGRHATCYKSVAQELSDTGAIYEDKEVVVDRNLVTSREPSDLPAFLRETIRKLKS